jgi:two-component system sensor histidine kinase YesM
MTAVLALCWLLPLAAACLGLLYSETDRIRAEARKDIRASVDQAAQICGMRLEEALNASKKASYDPAVRDSYLAWKEDGDSLKLHGGVSAFLEAQYRYERSSLCTMVLFLDSPGEIYYTDSVYQDDSGAATGYERVQAFRGKALERTLRLSDGLDTGNALLAEGGRLYLVRNLMGRRFVPYGMIVMELSSRWVFESLGGVWGAQGYEVFIGGMPLFGEEAAAQADPDKILRESASGSGYTVMGEEAYAWSAARTEGGQELFYLAILDLRLLPDAVSMLWRLLLLAALFLMPLAAAVSAFFHTEVTKPVQELATAFGEVAAGRYGRQVALPGTSQEFARLGEGFNAMSRELQRQFEKIYLEELAAKDATIRALRAQISPHFLNNALEVISWEARMGGNEKVCRMIEALATVTDAAMSREGRPQVPLSEELRYVEAYLYLTRQRLGGRLEVEKQIDGSLLSEQVPVLTIQPLVENAVKHGILRLRRGWVRIEAYRQGGRMCIRVANSGGLEERDRARIENLLGGNAAPGEESVGIRSVDRRLRLMYGESCGLTIEDCGDQTASMIQVPLDTQGT